MPYSLRLLACTGLLCCAAGLFAQNSKTAPARHSILTPPAAAVPDWTDFEEFLQLVPPPPVFSCGADEANAALFERLPERAKRQAELDDRLYRRFVKQKNALPDGPGSLPYVVPVVVHIIHDGGPENISDAQVQAAIDHLNDAFGHMGYYAQAGPGVDAGVRFCLARRDPNGAATTGITRTQSPLTDMVKEPDDIAVKDLARWDPLRYVNIWVVRSISSQSAGPGVAGYAYFPASHGQPEDGMMCEAVYFGVSPSDDGVLIHEMGHYLGLYHTFQGGCPNDDCLLDGDRVCDTPPDRAQQTSCPFNSCTTDADAPAPNPFSADVDDMTENFMDYSPLTCFYRFTQGQADRMQATVEMIRASLLASDGCLDPCTKPITAAFGVLPAQGQAGSATNFTNLSLGAASYRWYVGGTLISTTQNPAYTFPAPGVFTVTLEVGNDDPNCTDKFSMDYTVVCPGDVSFSASTTTATAGGNIVFTSSTTGMTTLEWFVGGVSAGTGPVLNHLFPTPGTFQVVLVGTNPYCSKTFTLPVKILSTSSEICGNNIDDDFDGYVDCFDVKCQCFNGADCTVKLTNNFKAKLAWASQGGVNPLSTPVVANLNPQTDSISEIIVVQYVQTPNALLASYCIYKGDGSNKMSPDRFYATTANMYAFQYTVLTPAIGDLDGNGIPELVAVERDRKIRVYRDYTPGAVPPMQLWITSDVAVPSEQMRPMLADFDNDGKPEIFVGNDIFQLSFANPAAPTLTRVLDGSGPYGQFMYFNNSYFANISVAVDILSPADCNGDPDCNGLEIAAGPVIYSVDLSTTDGDGRQIKIQKDLKAMAPTFDWLDGYTAVADADVDGNVDVIVSSGRKSGNTTSRGVYVWNKYGLIRFMPNPASGTTNGALPCVANVYDDTKDGYAIDYPEIIVSSSRFLNCFNLHAAAKAPAQPWWWSLPTTDVSGVTGSTVFDFNGDGFAEVVYRDEENLRIMYGGAAPFPIGVDIERNWFKTPSFSGTSDEFPVVADMDNDGQAEIAANGLPAKNASFNNGQLMVFESANKPWMPCRTMWNQMNYHVVNVNDDLTIPKQQQKQWLEFPGPGSGKRPLNIYLSQMSVLDANSNFLPVPDAAISLDSTYCQQQKIRVRVNICNKGSADMPAGTPLQLYQSNPTLSAAAKYGTPVPLPKLLQKDSCFDWTFDLSIPYSGTLWGVLNDNGTHTTPFSLSDDFPVTNQPECDFSNNIFSMQVAVSTKKLDLGLDRSLCSSSVAVLGAGTGFARYRWQDGSPDSTFTAPGPGKYWVDAWDACDHHYTDTLLVTLQNIAPLELGPDRTLCAGDSLSLSAPGFEQVKWTPEATLACSDCPSVQLRVDSALTIRVTGRTGVCIVTDSLRVGIQPVPVPQWQTTPATCGGANGSITVGASGGTAPFLFDWQGGHSGAAYDSLPAGTYPLTVTNAEGCKSIRSIDLYGTAPTAISGWSLQPVRCFGGSDGQISVTLAGGLPPFDFDWSTGPGSDTLSLQPAGDYALTVTTSEGCTAAAQFTLTQPPVLALQASVDSTTCTGTTAAIALSSGGGTAPHTFLWNDSETSPSRTALPPGIYTVELRDANGCTTTQTFDLAPGRSPGLASAALTPARCFGEANGKIAVQTTGGTPPYQYNWPAGPGGPALENLPAGDYALTVTDKKGCTTDSLFTITQPLLLELNSVVDSTSCTSTTGNISLSGAGGTVPYQFKWADGPSTALRSALAPGPYAATLTDANGCTAVQNFTIEPGGSPALAATAVDAARCFGEANGKIQVQIAGGVAPYGYLWTSGPGGPALENLPAGTYDLTVSDVNGCTAVAQFSVEHPPLLLLESVVDSTSCTSTTGTISLSGAGGTLPYKFQWADGPTAALRTTLAPGPYAATLTDANGCTAVQDFTIEPGGSPALAATTVDAARCFGEANGKIAVQIAGGVSPYGYLWTSGPGGPALENLPAGTYDLTVSDVNGCTAVAQFAVTHPPLLLLESVVDSTSCSSATGTISLSGEGGTLPYKFQWADGPTAALRTALAPGPYAATLTDANGCTAVQDFTIEPGGSPAIAGATVDSSRCFGEPSGKIAVQVTGGVPPYDYLWPAKPGSPGGPVLDSLTGGTYAVIVTDANGCTTSAAFTVSYPSPLQAPATVRADTCAQSTGSVLAAPAGGTAPYQYLWTSGPGGPALKNLPAGLWSLTLTDAHGCTFQNDWIVPAVEMPAQFALSGDTITCAQPAVQGLTVPAPAGWKFLWKTPAGAVIPGAAQTLTTPGLYTVTATNNFGCTAEQTLSVPIDTLHPLAAAKDAERTIPCDLPSVLLDGSGSSAGTAYAARWFRAGGWSTPGWTAEAAKAGTYILEITDRRNGCRAYDTTVVDLAERIDFVGLGVDSVTCFGFADGVVRIDSIRGGTEPYLYALDGATLSSQSEFDGLAAGVYPLLVQDALGCTWEGFAAVRQPALLQVALHASDTSISFGQIVRLKATVSPKDVLLKSIQWSPLWMINDPSALEQELRPGEPTLFGITVQTPKGCTASAEVRVNVRRENLYLPNTILPGSTDNGAFTVFAGVDIPRVRLMRIYDRWGELLFERNGFKPNVPELGWDGTFRNKPVNPGVYVFFVVVDLSDGQFVELTGTVTVLR